MDQHRKPDVAREAAVRDLAEVATEEDPAAEMEAVRQIPIDRDQMLNALLCDACAGAHGYGDLRLWAHSVPPSTRIGQVLHLSGIPHEIVRYARFVRFTPGFVSDLALVGSSPQPIRDVLSVLVVEQCAAHQHDGSIHMLAKLCMSSN